MDTIRASKETNKLHTICLKMLGLVMGLISLEPNATALRTPYPENIQFSRKNSSAWALGSNVLQLLVYFRLKIITIRLDANAHTRKN